MNLLLDTHVFIWFLDGDGRLGEKCLKMVENPANRLVVSYFSLLEMSIKASIGRLEFDLSVFDHLHLSQIELLMPDLEVLRKYRVFDPANKDPFDNMLVALAIKEKMTLVTVDRSILGIEIKGFKARDARK